MIYAGSVASSLVHKRRMSFELLFILFYLEIQQGVWGETL